MIFFCIGMIALAIGLWKALSTPEKMVKCPHCGEEFDVNFTKVEEAKE